MKTRNGFGVWVCPPLPPSQGLSFFDFSYFLSSKSDFCWPQLLYDLLYRIAVQTLADESISEETSFFTGLTVTRDSAWNEEEIPLRPSTRDRHELPRRADPDASATTVIKSNNSSAASRTS